MNKWFYLIFGIAIGVVAPYLYKPSAAPTSRNIQATNANPEVSGSAALAAKDMDTMHHHPVRNVSLNEMAPTITHLVFPDKMDGYNVQLLTENFRFTPAAINREVVSNSGHAHLYVNGKKVSRIYSNWFHLPSKWLKPGVNYVTVSLNANDHSEWAIDETAIASTVRVILPSSK